LGHKAQSTETGAAPRPAVSEADAHPRNALDPFSSRPAHWADSDCAGGKDIAPARTVG